jgi:uncharacterized iron-regulated membrane protein
MSRLRRTLGWIHLYAGLVSAPFLFLLGITGSFLVFEYPLDHLFHPGLAYVRPAEKPLPLATLIHNIKTSYPTAHVVSFALSPSSPAPDLAYTVQIQLPQLPYASTAFVNQYTGHVLGKIDGESFASAVQEFHTSFLLGEHGAFVAMVMACFLIILSVSGIVLWWPRKLLRINWSASGRRINFDLHNTIGFYSSVFMLLFGITGVVVHWQSKWLPLTNQILHLPDNEPPFKTLWPLGREEMVSLDDVAAQARSIFPGARLTQINMPGPSGVYRVWFKYPEDGTPLGRTFVLIHPYTGAVLYTRNARTIHVPTRFFREWNRELHTGDILGWPTRILACIMSLMLPALAITGPIFWWKRTRKKAPRVMARTTQSHKPPVPQEVLTRIASVEFSQESS